MPLVGQEKKEVKLPPLLKQIFPDLAKHRRVQNGDFSAVEVDEKGDYCLGDFNDVDWVKIYKTLFKKVAGCLNAIQNGNKTSPIETEWLTVEQKCAGRFEFVKKTAEYWPENVRLDAVKRGILQGEVFRGRDDFCEIDCSDAKKALLREFPSECEYIEQQNGLWTSYRLAIHKLLSKGCAY